VLFELSPVLREAVALLAEASTEGGITSGAGRTRGLAGTGLLLSCLYTSPASVTGPAPDAVARAGRGASGPVPAASVLLHGAATSDDSALTVAQMAIARATPLLSRVAHASFVDGALLAEYVDPATHVWPPL
jgi:flavin-binding protein dodecin